MPKKRTLQRRWQKIVETFDTIRNAPIIFQKITPTWRRKAEMCGAVMWSIF